MKKAIGMICLILSIILCISSLFLGNTLPLMAMTGGIGICLLICGIFLVRNKSKVKIKKAVLKKIAAYFSESQKFALNDNIAFLLSKDHYQNLDDIDVLYKGNKVCTLNEFGDYYPEEYAPMLDQLIDSLQKKPVKETISEEENQDILTQFTDKINEYNIAIVDESISNDLYKTCALLKQLHVLQTHYPKINAKYTKLTEYYLPILCEIVENYTRLNRTQKNSEELLQLEEKLRKSVLLINEAIKNITSSLFEEEKMNLNADMSVLETLLKKDGLIEEEMNLEQLNAMMKE